LRSHVRAESPSTPLAWSTFGEANGVNDLAEFRARLSRIRDGARIEADSGGRIGCCLVAESVFLAENDWVQPPRDWSPRIQTGASWDLEEGEGGAGRCYLSPMDALKAHFVSGETVIESSRR
jgi:hypothetical protein